MSWQSRTSVPLLISADIVDLDTVQVDRQCTSVFLPYHEDAPAARSRVLW